jgi:hypothetical protein
MKLSEKAKSILNDERLVQRQKNWFKILEDLFNDRPNRFLEENIFVINGIAGSSGIDPYSHPEEWIIGCLEDLAARIGETDIEGVFVPACIEYPPYGVHFIDRILGAHVFFKNEQWWADCLDTSVGKLRTPDLKKNETWDLARRAAMAFLEQEVRLPVFGLPTIASALNVLINLYGQESLSAILLETEAAVHDLKVINNLLINIHKWYRSVLPREMLQPVVATQRTQPFDYGQICGCSTALISGECYREFIAPLDNELLGVYPNGGMIHLCGSHLQHIQAFHSMKNLQAVQINDRASWDLAAYFNALREDQIIYLNPCPGMTAEKAVTITGGRRLVIAGEGIPYKTNGK